MGNGKIGIGPEGRLAAVIQFVVLTVVLTLIFVYGVSPASIVAKLLPGSLIMLITFGLLLLIGDSFPLSPPQSFPPTSTSSSSILISALSALHLLGR